MADEQIRVLNGGLKIRESIGKNRKQPFNNRFGTAPRMHGLAIQFYIAGVEIGTQRAKLKAGRFDLVPINSVRGDDRAMAARAQLQR